MNNCKIALVALVGLALGQFAYAGVTGKAPGGSACRPVVAAQTARDTGRKQVFIPADDPYIQYMGRVDFSDPKRPRCWAPGVTVRICFSGSTCRVVLEDEVLYGNSHNYVEIIVDDHKPYRIQTKTAHDTIQIDALTGAPVGASLDTGSAVVVGSPAAGSDIHTLTICKDTESGIGWLAFEGLFCEEIQPPPPLPMRKIEFIGNSITCGAGMDETSIPCGHGKWYDQHNAWLSYGPLTARALKAQWVITAVSGIGLMQSCCNMGSIIMPRVFDKIDQRIDSIPWDLSRYQPDVVTVCLGQNDGMQDSTLFCANYVAFLKKIREDYPSARILCLTSPMADERLNAYQKKNLALIAERMHAAGDKNVYTYFFSKRYFHGCGGHPDMEEHKQIAAELTACLKKLMGWK